ncbi:MAG: nitroreductase family protein [Chloroflexi bacterium]|nr:nitroreductase family protein [Chloroflexota bacterium]
MMLEPAALLAWIESRRSVRRFSAAPVPRPLLERLLHTACAAPSAHNRQPWRYAVVSAGKRRRALAQAMADEFRRDLQADGLAPAELEMRVARASERLIDAPAAVILCCCATDMDAYPDTRRQEAERVMALQSVSLAGGQLMLAAHAHGLGACWMCGPLFAPLAVRTALKLPQDWEPQALILIGWPEVHPEPSIRRPHEDVTLWR